LPARLVHNGGVSEANENPCVRHDCHACCIGTEMTLTEADVALLEDAGWTDFCHVNRHGDLELGNRNGRCVFLDGSRCRVYRVRPEGCRLYPFVLDIASDRVVRDRSCPHRGEFSVSRELTDRLRRSVARERVEADRREGRGDAG
jgi:Fe-S-cluster containining protein